MSNNSSDSVDMKEFVSLLIKSGLSSHAAKVLACLLKHENCDSSGLQKNCQLRQPEVSIGIAELSELGIVEIVSQKTNGRGRPRHKYSLCCSVKEALQPIILRNRSRIEQLGVEMRRLEEIAEVIR